MKQAPHKPLLCFMGCLENLWQSAPWLSFRLQPVLCTTQRTEGTLLETVSRQAEVLGVSVTWISRLHFGCSVAWDWTCSELSGLFVPVSMPAANCGVGSSEVALLLWGSKSSLKRFFYIYIYVIELFSSFRSALARTTCAPQKCVTAPVPYCPQNLVTRQMRWGSERGELWQCFQLVSLQTCFVGVFSFCLFVLYTVWVGFFLTFGKVCQRKKLLHVFYTCCIFHSSLLCGVTRVWLLRDRKPMVQNRALMWSQNTTDFSPSWMEWWYPILNLSWE